MAIDELIEDKEKLKKKLFPHKGKQNCGMSSSTRFGRIGYLFLVRKIALIM